MARAVWTGAVSFGLVNVPVKAFTASRDHEIHFHQLEKGTGARIRYQKVPDKTGREVGADDIDPIYYEKTYWLAPADETAAGPYRLLLAAIQDRGRVGIGSVVMRRKQYLAAIRPLDGALALSTMRFADEVVGRDKIEDLPSGAGRPDKKELQLATTIVDALAADWEPERYHDTYTDELKDLIERRAAGETITVDEEPGATAEVIDLMAALEASGKRAAKKAAMPAGSAGKGGASRRASARKAAAGKKAPARKAAPGSSSRTRTSA